MLNIPDHKGIANQRYQCTPVRMATTKSTTTNDGKDVGGKEPPYTAGGNVN
jgi:hypothetical protein